MIHYMQTQNDFFRAAIRLSSALKEASPEKGSGSVVDACAEAQQHWAHRVTSLYNALLSMKMMVQYLV